MHPKVDIYLNKASRWQTEMQALRTIILDCGLDEEFKWGKPCYSFEGSNIVILQPFKNFLALLFFAGALLKDPKNILEEQGENTQAARRLTFANVEQINKLESTIKAYLKEALANEKAGLKVKFKKTEEFKVPEELQQKLDSDPAFKSAFEALTPGRQRGYLLHFSSAKQSKTRTARIERAIPKIMDGKGYNER